MTANIFRVVGSDLDIVALSRVSTGKSLDTLSENKVDSSIKNLIRRRHWSPFEMQHIYIDIEAPIYVLRQLMRSPRPYIEQSMRYTTVKPKFDFKVKDNTAVRLSGQEYLNLIANEAKPEEARKVLPMATYSKIIWNPNLRNLLHFLNLRLDEHAQEEIQDLAQRLYNQLFDAFPVTMKYFTEYTLGDYSLSVEDLKMIVYSEDPEIWGDKEFKNYTRIRKNAEKRISMVKRVTAGRVRETPDVPEDSEVTRGTSADGTEVSPEICDPT